MKFIAHGLSALLFQCVIDLVALELLDTTRPPVPNLVGSPERQTRLPCRSIDCNLDPFAAPAVTGKLLQVFTYFRRRTHRFTPFHQKWMPFHQRRGTLPS